MKAPWSIVIYGKWKAMGAVCELLDYLDLSYTWMDDDDLDEEIIKWANNIVVTPWIKPTHRIYERYKKKILSELSFIWKLIKGWYLPWRNTITLVAITGTNGKSTTTRALYQACMILESKKKISDQKKVYIGGNFDRPLSGLIVDIIQEKKSEIPKIIILEVSSFMLWHLTNIKFSIGVLLNMASDHIDRHGTMKDYLKAKLNTLIYADTAITTAEIKKDVSSDQMWWISLLHRFRSFTSIKNNVENRLTYKPLENFSHPKFPWAHNAYNFWAIDIVLEKLYGDYNHKILYDIDAVAHRLQSLSCKDNITLIDDSVSSSAHALEAALDAMSWRVVLIAWWCNNGENYDWLVDKLWEKLIAWVFYGQTRTLLYPLAKQWVKNISMVETLEEALELAWKQAKKEKCKTILYSPWAKSFDQFSNVYERIALFESLVQKYKK